MLILCYYAVVVVKSWVALIATVVWCGRIVSKYVETPVRWIIVVTHWGGEERRGGVFLFLFPIDGLFSLFAGEKGRKKETISSRFHVIDIFRDTNYLPERKKQNKFGSSLLGLFIITYRCTILVSCSYGSALNHTHTRTRISEVERESVCVWNRVWFCVSWKLFIFHLHGMW